jgi:hypothetical protein
MIHQPYEDWLLANPARSYETLSSKQAAALRDHLAGCETCRQLADALGAVESQMQRGSMLAPEPGFTGRWQARLEANRERVQQRQSLGLLGLSASAVILLLGVILAISWPMVKSPGMLALIALYQASKIAVLMASSQRFLADFLSSTGFSLPWAAWVLLVGIVSQLGVLWIVSYRLLVNPRRITK